MKEGKGTQRCLVQGVLTAVLACTLQSIRRAGEEREQRVSSEFLVYGTRTSKDKSGAYLFLPDGEAKVQELPPRASRSRAGGRLTVPQAAASAQPSFPHSPTPPRTPQ